MSIRVSFVQLTPLALAPLVNCSKLSVILIFFIYLLGVADSGKNGFGKGKKVASLKTPDKESVQTITLPQDTKARYVTLELNRRSAILKFREIEIYNGPLLGKSVVFETRSTR